MVRRRTWLISTLLIVATIHTSAGQAWCQTTWYVDDDAIGDPAPGDPAISDPAEDGTAGHPFDAIQEGIDAAVSGDTVLVLAGTYTGAENRDLDPMSKAILITGQAGAENTIIDCELAGRGFNIHRSETSQTIIDGLTIFRGSTDMISSVNAGGIYCTMNARPLIRNCIIEACEAESKGGGFVSSTTTAPGPTLFHCTFRSNTATFNGGAVYLYYNSAATFLGCTFVDNDSGSYGSTLYCLSGAQVDVKSCLVTRSTGSIAMYFSGSDPIITNCTVSDNEGRGILLDGASHGSILNSIFWANGLEHVGHWAGSTSEVSHSNLEGGWPGQFNTDYEPRFTDSANDDYSLAGISPCINLGDPDYVLAPGELDLAGVDRVMHGRIDMGAYENASGPPMDADGDELPDDWELGWWPSLSQGALDDSDGDGLTNLYEYRYNTDPANSTQTPTTVPAGLVEGLWTWANSPYLIAGDISIASGTSLEIGPGVELRFSSGAGLQVVGVLRVLGVLSGPDQAPVVFTSDEAVPAPGDWSGLSFTDYSSATELHNTAIEYANCGVLVDESRPGFYGCTIRHCFSDGAYVSSYSSWCDTTTAKPVFEDCVFLDNGGYGIRCLAAGSNSGGCTIHKVAFIQGSIKRCLVTQNAAGGIHMNSHHGAAGNNGLITIALSDSVISSNQGDGLTLMGTSSVEPPVINNTICNNEGAGVRIDVPSPFYVSDIEMHNNIVAYNNPGVDVDGSPNLAFGHNDVWGNPGGDYSGSLADQTGVAANISMDPLFIDPAAGSEYRLASSSPCIDSGNNAVGATETDFDGNARRADDAGKPDCQQDPGSCGTAPIIDMGACEFQGTSALLGDMDCNGVFDLEDVPAMVNALLDPLGYADAHPGCDIAMGDFTADAKTNGADIQAFVDTLLGS